MQSPENPSCTPIQRQTKTDSVLTGQSYPFRAVASYAVFNEKEFLGARVSSQKKKKKKEKKKKKVN